MRFVSSNGNFACVVQKFSEYIMVEYYTLYTGGIVLEGKRASIRGKIGWFDDRGIYTVAMPWCSFLLFMFACPILLEWLYFLYVQGLYTVSKLWIMIDVHKHPNRLPWFWYENSHAPKFSFIRFMLWYCIFPLLHSCVCSFYYFYFRIITNYVVLIFFFHFHVCEI